MPAKAGSQLSALELVKGSRTPAFAGVTKVCVMAIALSASGCTGSTSMLEKAAPLPADNRSLIHPPWEALVKAGPGAEKDIDLETLNGPQAVAPEPQPVAPPVSPAVQQAPTPSPPKPGATAIKAVAVLGVDGTTSQGNRELTVAMRKVLSDAGWPILEKPRKDALTVQGHVAVDAAQGPNQTVHLTWAVISPKGQKLGSVDQSNAVPAHSLDGSWGQTAEMAAQAAADGLFKLIGQYR